MNATEQIRIIEKGCQELVGRESLMERIAQGATLRVKFGMDPTAPDLHLGHAVVLRKLRQMQDLGHTAVIVIGDATAQIGDPSGRSKTRRPMSHEEVLENAATYREQVFRILDPARTEIRFNTEWLFPLALSDILRLMGTGTVAQMLEREDFAVRFSASSPIGLHEFLYPLMQAYDSVALAADIELGGTDQRFNILLGRSLQRHYGQAAQAALFMPLLEGVDGQEKMSKSLGNQVGISEPSAVMFEKLMNIPDALILRYFLLCTDEHPDRVAQWEDRLVKGANPRDVKHELARIVTTLYHGPEAASQAAERFDRVFHEGLEPEDMPLVRLADVRAQAAEAGAQAADAGNEAANVGVQAADAGVQAADAGVQAVVVMHDPLAVLVLAGLAASRGEARRLIRQGGVRLRGEMLASELPLPLRDGDVIRCGKKGFVRLKA